MNKIIKIGLFIGHLLIMLAGTSVQAQITPSPNRAEGEGPFNRLIIRGVTMISGTGAPPLGPVDIVVEKNKWIYRGW